MKLYRIKDWEENYESRDSKRSSGPLKWYQARVKMDGLSFILMMQEPDAMSLFGTWNVLLMVAANQDKERRGEIASKGVPLSLKNLSLITRVSEQQLERALSFFSDPRIGWIEVIDTTCAHLPQNAADMRTSCASSAQNADECGKMPQNAAACGKSAPTLQERRVQEITGEREDSVREAPLARLCFEDEPPATPSSPEKSNLQLRAEAMHGKRASTPWDRSELAAWKIARQVVEATTQEEWELLEWFYQQPQEHTFARKALAQTLNNWAGEISKAKALKARDNPCGAIFTR